MLTPEKMAQFNVLISNNQAPQPEDSADFEIYKAMMASAMNVAPAVEPAPVAEPVATPVTTPAVSNMVTHTPAPRNQEVVSVITPINGNSYSMDDLMSNSMLADKYIKVRHQQTTVGGELVANKEIYGILDFADVRAKQSIKAGNPVKYRSTVDGKTCIETGGTWIDAITEMKRISPDAKPYNCVDFTIEVAQDIKTYEGQVVAEAGTRLGHTTATTNWKYWLEFWRSLPEHTGSVYVKITREDVKKDANQWALLKFEYIPNEMALSLGLANH